MAATKKNPPTPVRSVNYWPIQKPFVGRGPYPATVVEELKDGSCRLSVDNPGTGRTFNVTATKSEAPASGCFTDSDEAAPAKGPSGSSDVTVTTTVTGA